MNQSQEICHNLFSPPPPPTVPPPTDNTDRNTSLARNNSRGKTQTHLYVHCTISLISPGKSLSNANHLAEKKRTQYSLMDENREVKDSEEEARDGRNKDGRRHTRLVKLFLVVMIIFICTYTPIFMGRLVIWFSYVHIHQSSWGGWLFDFHRFYCLLRQ